MLNLNLDPKDIERAVVDAIIKASIGTQLTKAIDATFAGHFNRPSVFQEAVNDAVRSAVIKLLDTDEWREKITAHVRAKLEAMPMGEICGKVLDKISNAAYRD